MTCNKCIHRVEMEVPDDNGFDLESRLRQAWTHQVDYCDHHDMSCEDAYLRCEYRDLEVTAEEIQHVINLINVNLGIAAITELNKLLEG